MDDLPEDVTLHCLSYLIPKHLVQCKRLNSKFFNIIQKNRRRLNYPRSIVITQNRPNILRIECILGNCPRIQCDADISNLNKVAFKPGKCYHSNGSLPCGNGHCDRYLFLPLLSGAHSLQNVFDLVLKNANVDLIDLRKVSCTAYEALSAAIKTSKCGIGHIIVNLCNPNFNEEYELLLSIGNTRRPGERSTWLQINNELTPTDYNILLKENWAHVRKLNEIAPKFRCIDLMIIQRHIDSSLAFIAEEWNKDPFPIFFQIIVIIYLDEKSRFSNQDKITFSVDVSKKSFKANHTSWSGKLKSVLMET